MAARGRVSFETHTGFTVVGAALVRVLSGGMRCDLFAENSERGLNQVRVHTGAGSRTALLQFDNGAGAALAILPGFIGTVSVDEGRVVNVSYTPSQNTTRYLDYRNEEQEVEKRRAFAAVAAGRGYFRVEPDKAAGFSDYVRNMKALDPTLGLYAAYGYFQANLPDGIQSVQRYMEEDARDRGDGELPLLFDVVLLNQRLRADMLQANTPGIAPFCPLLTQGWSYLFADAPLHPAVRVARDYLLPGLWTTFTPEGVSRLARAIEAGGLR
jgi:hypothetical protein